MATRYRDRVIFLPEIRSHIERFEPEVMEVRGRRQASVALILRESEDEGPEMLFIERATREGDPWSGHMAFPGGRLDGSDKTSRGAAERETVEEVGLSLAGAEYLGPLGDVLGNPRVQSDLVISAHMFHVQGSDHLLSIDRNEVAEAFWFPVADLLDPVRHVDYKSSHMRGVLFPGIEVGVPERHVVWGLTYRFLDIFFEAMGRPLPNRWSDIQRHGLEQDPR